MKPIAYGIDFGTTNSSISVAYPDRVDLIDLGEEIPEVMPSIVYLHRDGNRSAGADAVQQFLVTGPARTRCSRCDLVDHVEMLSDCKQYKPGEGCLDARLPVSIKSELAQIEFVSTHSWAIDFSLPDLVAVILAELKARGDRQTGADVRNVVLGHPVAFVGTEGAQFEKRQAAAEERLTEAALVAGFEQVVLYQEPAAAVINEDLEDGLALAVDFGGGTFDVAIIEFHRDGGDIIALQGAEVGGELFDRYLFAAKVGPALGLLDDYQAQDGKLWRLPAWFRVALETMRGAMQLLSSPSVPGLLRDFKGYKGGTNAGVLEEILFGGHAYGFYKTIENAKMTLSDTAATVISFHRPGVDIEIPVTRGEFEELIRPSLDVVMDQVTAGLGQAGAKPSDIEIVLRTGGSSRIPAFIADLESMFGASKVAEREVFTTVADGLGTYAQSVEWET